MSVRNNPPSHGVSLGSTVSRYDVFLAVLPLPLLVGLLLGEVTGYSLHVGVGFGSMLSALLLGYGLFYDAPVTSRSKIRRRYSGTATKDDRRRA